MADAASTEDTVRAMYGDFLTDLGWALVIYGPGLPSYSVRMIFA